MITSVNNTVSALKNLWIEIFLDKTNKVTNVADGSILNATAYGAAKIAQKAIKDIAIVEAKLFPETATGEFLDKSAALFGVTPRKGALGSSTYIRAFADPGTEYETSMFFVNQNGIRFSIDVSVTVGKTGYAYIPVRSVNAGYVTNVDANSINNITPPPQGHIECTNEYMATGGRDSEGDETFRIRVVTNLNALSKGTLEYFTQVFQNLDDRVLKVMNTGLGENGIYQLYLVTQNGISFTETELSSLLEKARSYFSLFELNLSGDVIGISLLNAEWFYVGSTRGLDFRLELNPEYTITEVRRSIQINITKYLDFRFWEAGKIVQWDDLLEIVKKTEGVKYVPDEFFFPYYDQLVPLNQLPRVRGFVMRDLTGNVLYDAGSNLSPLFYPVEGEDLFKGLSDSSLALSQPVYFTVLDENGNGIEGVKITAGNNTIVSNANGLAVMSLTNSSYIYTAFKKDYVQTQGDFVVLNSPIYITINLKLSPFNIYFTVVDEKEVPIQGATISIAGETLTTNVNGEAQVQVNSGTFPYSIVKLGYNSLTSEEVVVTNSDVYIPTSMKLTKWNQLFIITSKETGLPVSGVLIEIDKNFYVTDENGRASIGLTNGSYIVKYSKQGYEILQGSVTVLNQEEQRVVSLTSSQYSVTINVKNKVSGVPLSGATVNINNGIYLLRTDSQGKVTVKLINGTYIAIISMQGYDNTTVEINVFNNDLSLQVNMEYKHYAIFISVLNENNQPIEGAIVTLNQIQKTTNVSGLVEFSAQNGLYSYNVVKLGFYPFEDTFIVDSSDNSIIANLVDFPWETKFIVKDGSELVEAALIEVNGLSQLTDVNGEFKTSLINGVYPYSVKKLGFIDFFNSTTIRNAPSTITIPLLLKSWNVIFIVTSRGIVVEGASVTIEGVSVITNAAGVTSIGLSNGTHQYIIESPDHETYSGEVTILNADSSVEVSIIPLLYAVTFTISEQGISQSKLQNVTISVDNQILITNILGEATVQLPTGTFEVKYIKEGFLEIDKSIVIFRAPLQVDQSLNKLYLLDFFVKGSDGSLLVGAEVAVLGTAIIFEPLSTDTERILITDETGRTPQIDVINGDYSFGALFSGYSPVEGSGIIENATKTENIVLEEGFETLFIVTDGTNPLEGVKITIDGVSVKNTNAEGEVSIFLSQGTHNWKAELEFYYVKTGSIVVTDQTQTIDIELEPGGTLTVTTLKENLPVQDMSVEIDGRIKQTNTNGEAQFVLLEGTYDIKISGNTFEVYEKIGAIIMERVPLTYIADLTNYLPYNTDFVVNYKNQAVEGVVIDITGTKLNGNIFTPVQLTTSLTGLAKTELVNGNYRALYTKSGYKQTESNFTVDNVSKTLSNNILQYHTVIFTLIDVNNIPVEGVEVTFDETRVLISDSQGKVTFNETVDGVYNYSTKLKDLYQPTSGEITVNGNDIDKQVILIETFDFTANCKDQFGDPVSGEKVRIFRELSLNVPDPSFTSLEIVVDVNNVISAILPISSLNYVIEPVRTERYAYSQRVRIKSETNDPVTIDLIFTKNIILTVVVQKNESTEKVFGAQVKVRTGEIYNDWGSSDTNGECRLKAIPGDGEINIVLSGYRGIESRLITVGTVDETKTFQLYGFYNMSFNAKRMGLNCSELPIIITRNTPPIDKTVITDTNGNAVLESVIYSNNDACFYSVLKGPYWVYFLDYIFIESDTNIEISLPPLYRMKVSTGQEGVTVAATGSITATLTTTAEGEVLFVDIPTGSVQLVLSKAGYENQTLTETFDDATTLRNVEVSLIKLPKLVQVTESNPAYQMDMSYKYVTVLLFGGGGAGGSDSTYGNGGGGGSSGAYTYRKNLSFSPTANIEIGSISNGNGNPSRFITNQIDLLSLGGNSANISAGGVGVAGDVLKWIDCPLFPLSSSGGGGNSYGGGGGGGYGSAGKDSTISGGAGGNGSHGGNGNKGGRGGTGGAGGGAGGDGSNGGGGGGAGGGGGGGGGYGYGGGATGATGGNGNYGGGGAGSRSNGTIPGNGGSGICLLCFHNTPF